MCRFFLAFQALFRPRHACCLFFMILVQPFDAIVVTMANPSPAAATAAIPASTIVTQLRRGETVDLRGVRVEDDLDVRAVHEVVRPLRCQLCHFSGDVLLADALFRRAVNLSGSRPDAETDADGVASQLRVEVLITRALLSRLSMDLDEVYRVGS